MHAAGRCEPYRDVAEFYPYVTNILFDYFQRGVPSSWGAKDFGEVGMLVSKEVDCLVRAAIAKDEQVSVFL